MKATKKNVAAAILKKHGHKVELVKGNGYFYFAVEQGADFYIEPITYAKSPSVYINAFCGTTVEWWVGHYEYMIEDVVVPENAGEKHIPRTIKMNF